MLVLLAAGLCKDHKPPSARHCFWGRTQPLAAALVPHCSKSAGKCVCC